MTRDEVLAMPAGREMDALVAERVMGWVRDVCDDWMPSHDNAAAWEVADRLCEHGLPDRNRGHLDVIVQSMRDGVRGCFAAFLGPYWGHQSRPTSWLAEGATFPEAICRAALLTTLPEAP